MRKIVSFQKARSGRAAKRASDSVCIGVDAYEFGAYLMRLRSQLEDIRQLVVFLDLSAQLARRSLKAADPGGRLELQTQMDDIDAFLRALRGRILSLKSSQQERH